MKYSITIVFLLVATLAFSQVEVNHFGLGLNYSNTQRVPSEFLQSTYDELPQLQPQGQGYGVMNRIFSTYEFGLKPAKLDFLFFDFDLMQGTDYIWDSYYDSYQNGDTNFYISSNVDIVSSLVGLRAIARVTTPSKKRFFYNVGLGFEYFLGYNADIDGNQSYSANSWINNYNVNINNQLRREEGEMYHTFGLVQQAGLAFRLGKDEASFPLNQTYLETDFQIINSFTQIDDQWGKYRTYGFTLSLVYEIQ
jgi:hypothetical protein